ncbi:YetF domain-containing protein [Ornithinimicrobium avium]|uniref:DUF421 domain-containing protein n=1 Tax=Ornithinimicrobium avium TaxID=2283195 RepID=A0A345NQI3_9MICO|nr:YetF domain-containing protein [Ornithinimicrobium avium]AXH97291.1 hypothetical protein DV701_15260 [Ornithinimicrobium avium]
MHAALVIVTLVLLQRSSDFLAWRFTPFARVTEEVPSLLVPDGARLRQALDLDRLDESDIVAADRKDQGLERLDQVKSAALESSGEITVVPRQHAAPQA